MKIVFLTSSRPRYSTSRRCSRTSSLARTASSSARAGHPPEAGPALSKEGDEAVARMRAVYDKRRKLMVELMREVGFGIPVMPQGAFYVFADASKWTDDSYKFAFELLEKAGVDGGQMG